jgi:uncharacterized protein (UPF0276 family)
MPKVGLGYQTIFHEDLMGHLDELDFVEVSPDMLSDHPVTLGLVGELSKGIETVLHGIQLSFASDAGMSEASIEMAQKIISLTGAKSFSDHFAFTGERNGDTELYVPPVLNEESLETLVERASRLKSLLGVEIQFENVASLFRNPFNELEEGAFLRELCRLSGARLILNIDSIVITSRVFGVEAETLLRSYPLEYVESITVVPSVAMNPMLRAMYAEDVDRQMWRLLGTVLAESDADSVVLQRRFRENDFAQMRPFIERTREVMNGRVS